MNYISNVLSENNEKSVYSFIPFITAGYPNIDLTIQAITQLDKEGADIIELGIPYSDALADGVLIQEASKVAIQNGVNIDKVMDILKIINNKVKTPIVLFTYYNPVLVKGIDSFIDDITLLNVKGLIIPDLPLEEADYVINLCKSRKLELILFISPTSSSKRISSIIAKAPGCLYLVSSTGVTGIRDSIDDNILHITNNILLDSNKMIMLGFGISTPSQIRNIMSSKLNVNGIVSGSAFTRIFSNYTDDESCDVIRDLGRFCRLMKSATLSID